MLVLSMALFSFSELKAQSASQADTTNRPRRAALLSAVAPGAGQVYNRKYWKAPIVWAGMGASIYFIIDNQMSHRAFRDEYVFRLNNPGEVNNFERFGDDDLLVIQEQYRRWRDLSIVGAVAIYFLQIIDATVDAHLLKFDIDDDLSLHISPAYVYGSKTPGLGFKLNF